MKSRTPDLTDHNVNPIPYNYSLSFDQLEDILDQLHKADSLTDIIAGIYRWGFTRGQNYQKSQQKKLKDKQKQIQKANDSTNA